MKVWKSWLASLCAIVVLFFIVPVTFNADIFDLLPEDAPTVAGLQRYQQSFGASEAIILSLEHEQSDVLTRVLPVLAEKLVQAGVARDAVWQNPLGENQHALAELLAFLWLNSPAEKIAQLQQRLSSAGVPQQLQMTLERIGSSFNAGEIAQLANDPLGLTRIAQQLSQNRQNPFASSDAKLRVMVLSYPGKAGHYFAYQRWLQELDNTLTEMKASGELPASLVIGKTGNPVFVTEFGSQLIRDLSLAALGTLLVVMLLFWWAHRSWQALVWLTAGLTLTMALTILLGSTIFGALNAVSFGFAALLMGLAVDYGLIVYQELRANPNLTTRQLRKHLSPSIIWAALTTAGAFFMLTRSSLPGLAQLGLLVALGILVAAVMVLYLFLPAVASTAVMRPVHTHRGQLKRHIALTISVCTLLACATVIFIRPPSVVTDVAKLQFDNNSAQQVHNYIQERLGKTNAQLWLIIEAGNTDAVGASLRELEILFSTPTIQAQASLPTTLWPDKGLQQRNIETLAALAAQYSRIAQQTTEMGFQPESLLITERILEAWGEFASRLKQTQGETLWPEHPVNRWLYHQFSSFESDTWIALGEVTTTNATQQELQQLAQQVATINGAQLIGWSLLADELASTMINDVIKVLVPMLIALTILLAAAFRHWVDVLLSFVSLAFGLLSLAALMSLLGWHWNIINLTALPLLLGAGVDYSIHIQLALKRYSGDLSQVFMAVGRAILLCGASTAVAFASLGLGSNAGIASLGKVTAAGIVIMALSAVFLLPQWWLLLRRQAHRDAL